MKRIGSLLFWLLLCGTAYGQVFTALPTMPGAHDAGGSTLTTGLEAWWDLEEASGTRVDAHGNNDLTDNATVTSATGLVGDAADFELDNLEYLSISDNASLSQTGSFTICAWVNHETVSTGSGDNRTISAKDNFPSDREYLLIHSGTDQAYRFVVTGAGGTTGLNASTFGHPSTGSWNLVCAWHDASAETINIQVNNGTVDSVAHTHGVRDSGNDFTLSKGSSNSFDGLMDSVGLWSRTLTASERTQLYNAGSGVNYSGL